MQVSRLQFNHGPTAASGYKEVGAYFMDSGEPDKGSTICECCGSVYAGDDENVMNAYNKGIQIGFGFDPKALRSGYRGNPFHYEHVTLGDEVLTIKLRDPMVD
jgi:hypothetical protein